MTKYRIHDERKRFSEQSISVYETEVANQVARLAIAFLEKWGPVLATADGEDSAGRQKRRSLTPQEIVDKACDIADAAWKTFHARGWVVQVPDFNEINAELDKKPAVNVGAV